MRRQGQALPRSTGSVWYPKLKFAVEIGPLETVGFSLWRQVGHGDILMYIDLVFPDYLAGLLLGSIEAGVWDCANGRS
jgi:hypothetical protein